MSDADTVKRNSALPKDKLKYRYVMDVIEQNIEMGEYVSGYRLPPIRQLADDFGLNFLTVRKAVHKLTQKGILDVRPGWGLLLRIIRTQHRLLS